jgi:hypothetical protein
MRMQMTRMLVFVLSVLMTLGLAGCSDDSSGFILIASTNGSLTVVAVSDCPRCDEVSSDDSFGRFAVASNVTRETSRAILSVCGFTVVSDRDGKVGRPLQIAACGGGVVLAFPSDQLSAFALRAGYDGRFGNGIRLGDPLQDVLARDPGLRQVDPLTFLRDDGTRRVEANFDLNLRLRELVVGRGFVR